MLRIGIVSLERHWPGQVSSIFPEWEMSVEQLQSPLAALASTVPDWDALVVDLDVVANYTDDLVRFVDSAALRSRRVIALVPPRFTSLGPQLSSKGTFILYKPTSSGEIALAIRMLLKAGDA
jgi:hypothetical protein